MSLATSAEPRTRAARVELGKAARARTPRSSLGVFEPASDRDPIGLIEGQAIARVPELVPIRHGRMAASAFAYYRGAALPMAADLGHGPRVGLHVQLCGDAHLSNFGGFASPERELVFDLNDFDETNPGPFDWDTKRLAASLEIAGRSLALGRRERRRVVLASMAAYRQAVRSFASATNLDVWYARLSIDQIARTYGSEVSRAVRDNLTRTVTKARSKDRLKAAAKLTQVVDGELVFDRDPPLLVPVEEVFADQDAELIDHAIRGALDAYRRSLPEDRRRLFDSYRYLRLARKVVGVGSVGTRAWVALFVGSDQADPFFLQIKEAEASVLEPYLGVSRFATHGQRVVEGQRLMQASSDIFLGHAELEGADGRPHHYYMRQLWDWKASAEIETMDPTRLTVYAQICGWTLARAHARSGDRIALAAYLGTGDTFERAMAVFADDYATQNEQDHRALLAAIRAGRLQAQTGI